MFESRITDDGAVSPLEVAGKFQDISRLRFAVRISFSSFTVDLDTRQLTQGGRAVHVSGKAFELLVALANARPKALSKNELQERLWPATFVAEANLSNLVAEIRQALGDSARTPRFIRTVHRFGYAFCGDATTVDRTQDDRPVCWIEWGRMRFPLAVGEHVIGRDEDVEIRLEASTVSRRHAKVIVKPNRAVLHDFGSKNGTFRGDERVTSSTPLADGDALRIGTVLVTFHMRSPAGTTRTASKLATRR
jgi:DNA-binding winged helix-turn-helix (wHTH) protein